MKVDFLFEFLNKPSEFPFPAENLLDQTFYCRNGLLNRVPVVRLLSIREQLQGAAQMSTNRTTSPL